MADKKFRQLTWRQSMFAPEFRIEAKPSSEKVAELLARLAIAVKQLPEPVDEHAARSAVKDDGDRQAPDGGAAAKNGSREGDMNAAFVIGLCDNHFRMCRSAEQLEDKLGDSRELRSIRRALDKWLDLMAEHGVVYRDLSGEVFDIGRQDFELIAEPEEMEGIEATLITRCERPAIFVDRQLIQRARGTAARPKKPHHS